MRRILALALFLAGCGGGPAEESDGLACLQQPAAVQNQALQPVTPLRSFSLRGTGCLPCSGGDQLMPLDVAGNTFWPPATPGAVPHGSDPRGPVDRVIHIRKVCITHWINGSQSGSYALVGHSGPNGDLTSRAIVGTGSACDDYPTDAPIVFSPGEYLDIHAACAPGGTHAAMMQIWYTE